APSTSCLSAAGHRRGRPRRRSARPRAGRPGGCGTCGPRWDGGRWGPGRGSAAVPPIVPCAERESTPLLGDIESTRFHSTITCELESEKVFDLHLTRGGAAYPCPPSPVIAPERMQR